MEATLHTAAGMSGCSARRLVVTFICFLDLIYLFFCLLVASLLHSHSRWDERADEIRSLCAAERSSDSCSDKSSSTLATDRLTACLQGRQLFLFIYFFSFSVSAHAWMHNCGQKKHPQFTCSQFSVLGHRFCSAESQKQPLISNQPPPPPAKK